MDTKAFITSWQEKIKTQGWKAIPLWIYGAAGGVVVLLLLLICCMGGSVKSDEDLMAIYDDWLEDVKDVDSSTWREAKSKRSKILRDLKGNGEQKRAVEFAALVGSMPALVYLVEEKGARLRSDAVDAAAACGHLDIVEYLIEEQGADLDFSALEAACKCGQFDVCKYLVEKQGLDATRPHCLRALCASADEYKAVAKTLSAFLCEEVTVDELKERHLALAEYFVEQGADASDESVKKAAQKTANSKLAAFLRKAAK